MDPAFPFFCRLHRSPLGCDPNGGAQCPADFTVLIFYQRAGCCRLKSESLSLSCSMAFKLQPRTFLGAVLFLAVYNFLPKIANAIAKKSGILKLEDALILKEAFEDIVGIKSDRIGGECETFLSKGDNSDPGQLFKSINQPDQQIYFTVNTIWKFLEKIYFKNL